MDTHRRFLRTLLGLVLSQTWALGAAEPKQQPEKVGVESELDGAKFYYADCDKLLNDAKEGYTTSEGSEGCGGLTPLHMAILHSPVVVSILLEAGADPNDKGGTESPPAHYAARFGKFQAVLEILKAGGDPYSTLGENWTLLHSLYASGEKDDEEDVTRKEVAQYLISKGVDIGKANDGGDRGDMVRRRPIQCRAVPTKCRSEAVGLLGRL